MHYGRSETFPWLFIHLSEGKEQKTLVEFSNKTTCCQQSYSFSRIFTENSPTVYFNIYLLVLSSPLSPAGKKHPKLAGEVSLPKPTSRGGDIFLLPSDLLVVLMSKWRHDTIPSLTFWIHQREPTSASPLVSKGHICIAPHMKANWKLHL